MKWQVHTLGWGWPMVVSAVATIVACTSAAGLDDLEFAAGTANAGGAGGTSTPTSSGGGIAGMGGEAGSGGAGEGGSISPPGCGNGMLDAGESCDDFNTASGDGCGSDCQLEGSSEGCPAEIAIMLGPAGMWLEDSTEGKADVASPSCGGTSAGDAVYRITVSQSGTVRATMYSTFYSVLAFQANCASGEIGCAAQVAPILLNVGPVTAGDTLQLTASGFDGAEGGFQLLLEYP